jgi:hypothetical protein
MAQGAAGAIGLARETTWGTPVAVASGNFVYGLSENVTLQIDRFDIKNIVGVRSEPDDVAGMRRIEGEMVLPGYPHALGHIFKGLTNSGSLTVVLSGFLHQYDYLSPTADASTLSPFPSYTMEIFRDVTSSNRYAGAVWTRGVFNIQPNQELRATVGVLAKTTSIIAKSAATYPGSPAEPFTYDTVSLSVGGVAAPNVEAFTFTIENNLEAVGALTGTNEPSFMRVRGFQGVSVSGTYSFDDLDDYNDFVNQTERAFVLTMTKANSFYLKFDLPRVVYTAYPLGIRGRDRLTVDFEGKVRYHTGSGTAYGIRLTSTQSNL